MPDKSQAVDVAKLAADLHSKKIINLDLSAKTFIETAGAHLTNPAVLAGWYIVGGDHFVIVCGNTASEEVAS